MNWTTRGGSELGLLDDNPVTERQEEKVREKWRENERLLYIVVIAVCFCVLAMTITNTIATQMKEETLRLDKCVAAGGSYMQGACL